MNKILPILIGLLPSLSFAASDITALDLTSHWAGYLAVILFVIAYAFVMLEEFTHLPDCGHGLCNYCYAGYLQSKVSDGVECALTVGPEQKCGMVVPERLF